MSRQKTNLMLHDAICRLSDPESLQGLFHEHEEGYPLPSSERLEEIIQLARYQIVSPTSASPMISI